MKVDLLQLLLRRRVPLDRWLQEHSINTMDQFQQWKTANEHQYTYPDRLDGMVKAALDTRMPPIEVFHTDEVIKQLVEVLDKEIVEHLEDEPKKRKKSAKGVQTSESDE